MSNALDSAQRFWALAAAIPFLLSIGLIGFALNQKVLLAFAIGWPILQVIGYVGSITLAKGDLTHHLVKAQVMLNYLVLALLAALLVKAF